MFISWQIHVQLNFDYGIITYPFIDFTWEY